MAAATLAVSYAVHGVVWPVFMRNNLGLRARRYWTESVLPAALPLVPAMIAHSLCGLLLTGPAGGAFPAWLTVLIPPAALVATYWFVILITRALRAASGIPNKADRDGSSSAVARNRGVSPGHRRWKRGPGLGEGRGASTKNGS